MNFFTAISDQIDPVIIYFINDEITESLPNRGLLGSLIKEIKDEHYSDEDFKRLQYAENDLQDLFSKRTDFIIGSILFDFKVNTFSVFEKYLDELYELLKNDKKESTGNVPIFKKIEYVLSKSSIQKEKECEARTFLDFYRKQRNTIHNLGRYKVEDQSIVVNGIKVIMKNGEPTFTEDHNSTIFAWHKLMSIYELMYESITGKTVF
jgi:hypothetical protein